MEMIELNTVDQIEQYKPHPYTDSLYGPVDIHSNEFKTLREQIALEHAVNTPAIVYEGKLIAGRKRALIAAELGLSLNVLIFEGNPDRALEIAVTSNTAHSQLNAGSKAVLAANYYLIAKHDLKNEVNMAKVAREIGVSESTVSKSVFLVDAAKKNGSFNIIDRMRDGSIPLRKITEMMNDGGLPPDKWQEATETKEDFNRIMREHLEAKQAIQATRETAKQNRIAQASGATEPLYNVVYTEFTDNDLNINFADNCIVFMWTARSQVHNAIFQLEEWTIKYQTMYTVGLIDKLKAIIDCEILIVGIRGNMVFNDQLWPPIQNFALMRPIAIGKTIGDAYPDDLKLSKFKQKVEIDGWHCEGEDKPKSNGKRRSKKTKADTEETNSGTDIQSDSVAETDSV